MRCTILAILALVAALAHAETTPSESSPVPIRWTVETSRVQPAMYDAYQGETLELEATMQSYGKPLAISGEAKIYWQTNGMGGAWWSAPAAVKVGRSGERDTYSASWTPSMDAGAGVYNCFIGQSGGNYRAEFRLRLRPSPGAAPNTLELPRQSIDFATVEVLNPPWLSSGDAVHRAESIGTRDRWTDSDGNIWEVTRNFGDWHYDPALDPWGVQPIAMINDYTGKWELIMVDDFGRSESRDLFATHVEFSTQYGVWTASRDMHVATNLIGRVATMNDIPTSPDDIGAAPAGISDVVNAWQTYWDGDDVRITVTNYYGSLDIPSIYLEQKMPAVDGHAEPWFRVVWDERTRWNTFMPVFAAVTNEVAQNKADRAWGVYDSSSGEYSPDGMLQISQPRVMIAPGMAWQKTILVGGGSVWVLRSTLPVEMSGTAENGFFRIEDGDGHALFEIVKGDKQVKPATSVSAAKTAGGFVVGYCADSPVHPVGEVCFDLADGTWISEDDLDTYRVTWSGDRPNWTAKVEPIGPRYLPDKLFFKASYEAGGNTYIRHNVATSLDKVVVGGREYTVTAEEINGKKLLVLR